MINSSILHRCGCKRPILKTASTLLAFIFLFSLLISSVIATGTPRDLGNQPAIISTGESNPGIWYGDGSNFYGSVYEQYQPYYDGTFNGNVAQFRQLAINPAPYRAPLIATLATTDLNQPYIIYLDTSGNLIIQKFSNNVFTPVITLDWGATTAKIAPFIVKFNDVAKPYIVLNTETALKFYTFNGSAMTLECSVAVSGYGAAYAYDYDFNWLNMISGEVGTAAPHYTAIFSNCSKHYDQTITMPNPNSIITPGTGDFRRENTIILLDSPNGRNGTHDIGFYSYNNGDSKISFSMLSTTLTGTPGLDGAVDGDDGLLGSYSCTDGYCSDISETTEIGKPLFFQSGLIIHARKSLHTIGAQQYGLLAMDDLGNYIWSTDGDYLDSSCGSGTTARNITFFDAALYDIPNAFYSQLPSGELSQPSVVCGACQPSCQESDINKANCDKIYLACYDLYDGSQLLTKEINTGANYFSRTTGNYFPAFNEIISGNFDSTDGIPELLIRDNIYNYLGGIVDNVFFDTNKGVHTYSYGLYKNYYTDYVYDPALFYSSNTTSKMLYINNINTLPFYDHSVEPYVISPCSFDLEKPICLNFTKNIGLKVSYGFTDNNSDTVYVKRQCHIYTEGGYYYNSTNFTIATDQNGGQGTESFTCFYNQTGQIHLKTSISDNIHLFNITPKSWIDSPTYTFSIIDSIYPNCLEDYAYECDENEPPPPPPPCDIPGACGNTTKYNETIVGGSLLTLCNVFHFCTKADRIVFGLLIIAIVTIGLIFIGLALASKYHFEFSKAFVSAIILIDAVVFVLLTSLDIFPVYFMLLFILLAAIIGAAAWLKMTGNYNPGGD